MDLKKLALVEKKLLEIREILKPEDAFQVCDTIIISVGDELLEEHIKDMLQTMGYEEDIIKKICKMTKEIQT